MLRLIFLLFLIIPALMARGQVCPEISFPLDGAIDIPVNATITWPAVSGINGYVISLGTTLGGTEILNSHPTGIQAGTKSH